jgi:hypothetical protein
MRSPLVTIALAIFAACGGGVEAGCEGPPFAAAPDRASDATSDAARKPPMVGSEALDSGGYDVELEAGPETEPPGNSNASNPDSGPATVDSAIPDACFVPPSCTTGTECRSACNPTGCCDVFTMTCVLVSSGLCE